MHLHLGAYQKAGLDTTSAWKPLRKLRRPSRPPNRGSITYC